MRGNVQATTDGSGYVTLLCGICSLYTSYAADELTRNEIVGTPIVKIKKEIAHNKDSTNYTTTRKFSNNMWPWSVGQND